MNDILQQVNLVSREKITMENKIEELENISRSSNLPIGEGPGELRRNEYTSMGGVFS